MFETITTSILLIGIVSFSVIWLTTSNLTLKEYLKVLTSKRALLTVALLILMLFQLFNFINLPFTTKDSIILKLVGTEIFISGWLLTIWAKFTMKKNWGPPSQHDIKRQKELVTKGPYLFTRNPIYVGLLMMFIGFEFAQRSYFVLVSIPLFYLIQKAILKEEKLLQKYFGREYLEYKKHTSRFI